MATRAIPSQRSSATKSIRLGAWLSGSVAALLLTQGSAFAQNKPNFTRSNNVSIDVKISDRVKPVAAKPAGEKTQPLSADELMGVENKQSDIRKDQLQILKDLIQDTPDREVEEKADLYFRLAEMEAQLQRNYRLESTGAQIKADTSKNAADKAKYQKVADRAAKDTKDAMIDAVKTYKALTENDKFKNYPKMDQALYYYGFTLQGGKYYKEARAVYDKLIKNYPQSQYIPEAHLAFADYYFEQNQLDDAEDRYKRVLQFPKSSVYWIAYYKMGWVDLNLGKNQEALETFYEVALKTKGDKSKEILNHAAKKDIVRAYAEVGNVQKALPYFQKVDKSYAFDMLQLLADLLLEQGKAEKAIYVYRQLMTEDPKNKNVCLWQYDISRSMLTAGKDPQKVEEIQNLVKLYGALKGSKTLPAAEMSECHDNAAAMAGELARAWHNESNKTHNPDTLAFAEKLYKVYLETFPDAEDFAETQYYYANLIWDRATNEKNARMQTEMWENAAVAFTDVVKTGKVDAKLMKDAAYAAVLGWKNALNVDPRVKQQEKPEDSKSLDKIPEAQPIPEREQKMLAAFDIYINYIKDPKDSELVGMKFMKANVYRRYNHFDEAMPIFIDIVTHHKEHETAQYSANLILDTYNRLGKFDDLITWVDNFLADPKFLEGKEDLKTTLESLKRTSLRKKAEFLEAQAKSTKDFGKYIECGKAYTDIYNRDPGSAGSDEVLFNAAVCFEEGKSVGQAISMFKILEKTFPTANVTKHAINHLGEAYGRIAYYDQAAKYLELYANKYGGEKDAKAAMSAAVFYQKGIGNDDKAIKDTNDYVAKFGSAKVSDAADAYFSLNSIYEKQGNADEIIKHLRSYIAKYGEKGGADKLVIAYTKIGQQLWAQSCSVKTVDGSCFKVTRERAVDTKGKKAKRTKVQTQCGPESKVKTTIVARDDKKVKEAQAAFSSAVSEFEKRGGKTDGDERGASFYYAQAKFNLAEKDYEAYIALKFPTNLNFDPANKSVAEKSKKRFDEWMAQKLKLGQTAQEKFSAIDKSKDAPSMIAARARIGQIAQNLTDALYTAEIPANIRPYEEAVDAYCDQLTQVAEPLESKSIETFTVCLNKSTELGYFSEWSKLCERELGQIKPEEFPTASEIHADAGQVAPITDVEASALKLE